MTLGKLELGALLYLVRNMRERDRHEIFCTTDETEEDLAARIWSLRERGVSFVAYTADGIPAGAFGAYRAYGGVFSLWMFGTDRWPEVRLGVTRFGIKEVIPFLFNNLGMTLGQCNSLADYPEIHKWLKLLGAQEDCVLHRIGKNGEDFRRFIWKTTL